VRAKGISLIGVLAAAALLASCGGSSQTTTACLHGNPDAMLGLTPPGHGLSALTLGLRVQRVDDVDNLAETIGSRILPRDVFVIDTEHPNSKQKLWKATLARVNQRFPCNRVMELVGLSPTPNQPSYQFALTGNHNLDGILVDWELLTYNGTGRGRWTPSPQGNLPRIRAQLAQLTSRLRGTTTRIGLAPQYLPAWDYGRTAALVAAANFPLDPIHRGYQVVQTQENCGKPHGPGPPIPQLTPQLLAQYRAAFGTRLPGVRALFTSELLRHLGFEIAFSTKPNPHGSNAEERLGPQQAAACTGQILKAGGAGILYWASPAAIEAFMRTSIGRGIRPAPG
jgi:hypothetical protein